MVRKSAVLLIVAGLATQVVGQDGGAPRYSVPLPMPEERAKDSYDIYSQLLKSGPIEWRDAKRAQWLVEGATYAVPLDVVCRPTSEVSTMMMNPHFAVKAPEDRQIEWNEVLADYDQHCHDVIQLDRSEFKTELPVHLLNAEDARIFMKDPNKPPAEFTDGKGLHSFTEVFFNANHTMALVEQSMRCGRLCGNSAWVVLEHKEGRWELLPWVRTFSAS